jgi:hypothetical protein
MFKGAGKQIIAHSAQNSLGCHRAGSFAQSRAVQNSESVQLRQVSNQGKPARGAYRHTSTNTSNAECDMLSRAAGRVVEVPARGS